MVGFQTTPNIRLGWQYDRLTQMANFESRLFQELCSTPIVQTPVCGTNFQPFAFLTLNMVLMIKSGSTKSARSIIVFQQSWNSFYWVACTGYIGQKQSDKKLTIIVSTLGSIAKSRYTQHKNISFHYHLANRIVHFCCHKVLLFIRETYLNYLEKNLSTH